MSSLGPAIVTGCVGVISTILSFLVARLSLKASQEQSQNSRSHEELMLLVPRRIEAIETLWIELYEIERGAKWEDSRLARIISATMWLPPPLRDQFTELLIDRIRDGQNSEKPHAIESSIFLKLREGLLEAAQISKIDAAVNSNTGS